MAPIPEKKPLLKDINCHLTCPLCRGYFVDATSVTECLHTFCRSCIVKHFRTSMFCPVCDVQVDLMYPTKRISPDPRKQLLVYKLVPHLHQKEMARQEAFLNKHKSQENYRPILPRNLVKPAKRDRVVDSLYIYGPQQKISLSLEYECEKQTSQEQSAEKQTKGMKRFLQCPAAFTMYHLKKFIRLKYDVSPRFEVAISYEGEPLSDNVSLMDVAYQFFWEAVSPMQFTYRITLRKTVNTPEQAPNQEELVTTRAETPPPLLTKETHSEEESSPQSTPRQVVKSNPATSSSNARKSLHRRQVRQRSAKTAAYKSLEAMDDDVVSDREETVPNKRRKTQKSPRWESDDSFDSFTVYRSTRSGKTPKPTAQDTEYRYYPRSTTKTVYSAAVSTSMTDESGSSDTEVSETYSDSRSNHVSSTKHKRPKSVTGSTRGRKANPLKSRSSSVSRKRAAAATDVYEFHSNNEDTNEDSNTTLEYEFVYDDSKESESDSQENNGSSSTSENKETSRSSVNSNKSKQLNLEKKQRDVPSKSTKISELDSASERMEVEDRELEQHIEMEEISEKDLEQHIEDSIEEVEIEIEGEEEGGTRDIPEDADTLDAETASTCLVIAEDEEDDGVVEEVIAAEEDGHELVVLENPVNAGTNFAVADTTEHPPEVRVKENRKARKQNPSLLQESSNFEEDEPEIVHEKVSRKKSKKTKHHHHHHKHKHRHSPVLLVPSGEEAPMKLTLKLRPTPSISPTNSLPSKSHQQETAPKTRKFTVTVQASKKESNEVKTAPATKALTSKHFKPVYYENPLNIRVSPPRSESPDIKSPTPEPLSPPGASAEEFSPKSPTPEPLSPRSTTPEQDVVRIPLSASCGESDSKTGRQSGSTKTATAGSTKGAVTSSRNAQVWTGSASASVHANSQTSGADVTRVKTPASLTISKVEAGEFPPRPKVERSKPALEILMLPPSPPAAPSEGNGNSLRSDKAQVKKTDSIFSTSTSLPKTSTNGTVKDASGPIDGFSGTQNGALDLSGRSKKPEAPASLLAKKSSPIHTYEAHPKKNNGNGSPKVAEASTVLPKFDRNVAQPHDLGLIPKSALLAYRNLNHSERMTAKLVNGLLSNGRPIPALNDLFPNRKVGTFSIASASSRPSQFIRHIPNPSALFQRQQQQHQQQQTQDANKTQQGQLTEAQLKERYQLFQQNQQAARAIHTYSRISHPGTMNKVGGNASKIASSGDSRLMTGTSVSGAQLSSNSHLNNNNVAMKNAVRSRSIEKVAAGLLSVRTGTFPLEAHAGR